MSRLSGITDTCSTGRCGTVTRPPVEIAAAQAATVAARGSDSVELSGRARELGGVQGGGVQGGGVQGGGVQGGVRAPTGGSRPVRTELVNRIRGEIANGSYDADEKLSTAIDRMIASIDLTA